MWLVDYIMSSTLHIDHLHLIITVQYDIKKNHVDNWNYWKYLLMVKKKKTTTEIWKKVIIRNTTDCSEKLDCDWLIKQPIPSIIDNFDWLLHKWSYCTTDTDGQPTVTEDEIVHTKNKRPTSQELVSDIDFGQQLAPPPQQGIKCMIIPLVW